MDTIGSKAFQNCSYLRYITIGYGVRWIYDSVFSECYRLEKIVIPDSVAGIGSYAFYKCGNLNTVCLTGELLDDLNTSVFENCTELNQFIKLQYNPFKVTGKTATIKAKKVKKKAQSLSVTKVLGITPSGTNLEIVKLSGNKNISINKTTGAVTVKKKTKKGTYSVKVKIRSTGSDIYRASDWQTVTFKIKIK